MGQVASSIAVACIEIQQTFCIILAIVGVLVLAGVAVGVVMTQVSTHALFGTAVIQISAPSTIPLGAATGIAANARICAWTSSDPPVRNENGLRVLKGER